MKKALSGQSHGSKSVRQRPEPRCTKRDTDVKSKQGNNTIKVLILSHSSETDGAEKSMLDLFEAWAKETDITAEFIIRKPLKLLAAEMDKRGWKYYPLYYTNWAQRNPLKNPLDIAWNAKQNKAAVRRIEAIIQLSKPDVVMTNTIVAPWAAIAANRLHIPHVWFVREYGGTDRGFEFSLGKDRTFADIGNLSVLVATNSITLAKHIGQYINPSKITTVYTPFDLEQLTKLAAEKVASPFQSDSLKLVIVGRIAPSKGQDVAAEAVGILNGQGIKTELCIVGAPSDSGDDDTLQTVINTYRIAERVHIVGMQSNPLPYVAQADVGIMASGMEAFGRTTFEYMALGKPVVGADSGATPEMVTPASNGFLYKLHDSGSLAAALQKYAVDSQLLARHAAAAKQKAIDMMASPYNAAALYRRIESAITTPPNANMYDAGWLDQAHPAGQFIKTEGIAGLPKLVMIKARQILKSAYLRFN